MTTPNQTIAATVTPKGTTVTADLPGPALPVDDGNINAGSQRQQDLLAAALDKKLLQQENLKKLKPFEYNLLANMQCVTTPNGLTILRDDGKSPLVSLRDDPAGGKAVVMHMQGPVDGEENIRSALTGAVMVKARGAQEVTWSPDNMTEEHYLMMVKSFQVAGVNVVNAPPPGQTLDDKYPELAAKVEATWKKMHDQSPQATETLDRTGTAASQIQPDNLGGRSRPELTGTFAAAAAGIPVSPPGGNAPSPDANTRPAPVNTFG